MHVRVLLAEFTIARWTAEPFLMDKSRESTRHTIHLQASRLRSEEVSRKRVLLAEFTIARWTAEPYLMDKSKECTRHTIHLQASRLPGEDVCHGEIMRALPAVQANGTARKDAKVRVASDTTADPEN